MTPLRVLLVTLVGFILGCGIGAAMLALLSYWYTERQG